MDQKFDLKNYHMEKAISKFNAKLWTEFLLNNFGETHIRKQYNKWNIISNFIHEAEWI